MPFRNPTFLFRVALAVLLMAGWYSQAAATPAYSLPQVFRHTAKLHSQVIALPSLPKAGVYSILFSVASPAAFAENSRVVVRLTSTNGVIAEKTLHAGDPDLYTAFQANVNSRHRITVDVKNVDVKNVAGNNASSTYTVQVNRWPDNAPVKSGSNHTWQTAAPMVLGRTVFASGDEAPYIPVAGTLRKQMVADPRAEDWYRFHYSGAKPQLVFFQLELMDRDDLPVDVSVFEWHAGKLEEYLKGQDPVSPVHEVQALPGNKFAPRVLDQPGEYYVRVRANHPEYKLRTRLNPLPPYTDPHQAVQTAADYIMGAGDSWFANTPRRGGTFDRISPVHQETSLCVACHPSHFSQRAQLYAVENGYAVHQKQQLQFLEERFYNNPRPFYGFEQQGAQWARVISAPANVLSRMSVLTGLFESNVSGIRKPEYHAGINKYLDLYYAGRQSLPPDETNGNTPLVSNMEVAWYSWKSSKDAKLPAMIASAPVKNMVDLCYQTLALAEIDAVAYRAQISFNAKRILSLQRADGQWSMKFEEKEPAVEFQTGHALWALAAAGIPVTDPQVAKTVKFLLGRQQTFGGWIDPLQSFENFRTPFRETQFAVVALSAYFPLGQRSKGWGTKSPDSLSQNPAELLAQLDDIWDTPSKEVQRQIEWAAQSNEVLIRQAAAEALGRLALPTEAPLLLKLLSDESKLVQRTAAWSLRQVYSRPDAPSTAPLRSALASENGRTRWGATRVFAHSFAALAKQDEVVSALLPLVSDPVPTVRMATVRALWQSWFWNAHPATRGKIEDSVITALGRPQVLWVETNLRAALYNIADENIRYLYNNWIPLMAREEDRRQAIQGRLAVENQLAAKLASALKSSDTAQQKRLLGALADLPLRRADIYDPNSELPLPQPLAYNRLGNDIEQIAFFGASAELIAEALLPLLDSPDPELRSLARKSALLVRDTPYTQVQEAAGGKRTATKQLESRIDGMPEAVEISKAFHLPQPKPLASSGIAKPDATAPIAKATEAKTQTKLNEDVYRAAIEPIFQAKGEDGYACVDCHATHTLFNAKWQTVANVVDLKNPENSLVLRKPISTAETEGVAGAAATAHGGGRRWGKGSSQYEVILRWIQSATDRSATTSQLP